MSRTRICGCGAEFRPRESTHRFCSRRCAGIGQKRRPKRPPHDRHHRLTLRLLDIQPLERRARGGWRFGTKTIGESTVAGLIASGRAEIRGGKVHPKRTEAP
ncbi:hypothetical protein [Bradyrhizobium tunisiense]|uniref:hypothetical protein n=1 Tax=Bradyrhizobium tunisiense TaxID=3278709 RepID=UPI0035DA6E7F